MDCQKDKNEAELLLDTSSVYGWDDFSVQITGANSYERRFVGCIETGEDSYLDLFV